jgi:hypothetical protein
MIELDSILQQATAEIEAGYFWLTVAGGDAPIYRERVYCYELYHQMRLWWPKKECPFVLNGEVDKRGHPILGQLGFRDIPDFLVHGPGYMEKNHAIIEVKNVNTADDDIERDLRKMTKFVKRAKYQRAIYLVYGSDPRQLVERIYRIAGSMPSLAPIELWLHEHVGKRAIRVKDIVGAASAATKSAGKSRLPA